MMRNLVRFFVICFSLSIVCNDNFEYQKQDFCAQISDVSNFQTNAQLDYQNQKQSDFYSQTNLVPHNPSFFERMSNKDLLSYVIYNKYCKMQYGMDAAQTEKLLRLSCSKFKQALFKKDLYDRAMLELLHAYRNRNNNRQKYQDLQKDVQTFLERRNKKKQDLIKKELQKHAQIELQKAQKELAEQQRCREIYNLEILYNFEFQSAYQEARQQALKQAQEQKYKKYDQFHHVDFETMQTFQSHGIEIALHGNKQATALQHQLYNEVANCYKKIAQFLCGRGVAESLLIKRGISFACFAVQATDLEVMDLAIRLSDLSHACVDTVKAVFEGIEEGLDSFTDAVLNFPDTAQELGICFGKVMKYIGDAAIANDSSGFGWSYYVKELEQEHGYDAVYAQVVIDEVKKWIEQSSWQEKIQVAACVGTETILYEGLFTGVGKVCSSVIAELPEIKFLGSFADIQAEYAVATEFGQVGLTSMEDVGFSLMESEEKMASEAKAISSEFEQASGKRVIDEIFEKQEYYKKYKPKEVKTNCLLEKNLKIAVDAEKDAARIKKLRDGRVRFYETERSSATPGPTRGSSYVIEYDPNKGAVRSWYESYDHAGTVNRVHPKMINGKEIKSLHYPHTGKELAEMANNMKGK